MLSFCTWKKVAAGFAAAALLCGANPALAQDAGYAPAEDDAILLQMQVRKYRLANEIRGYQTPGGVCVDLADVIQALDLPIRLDRKSRRATGWIFAESQTITIDRDSSTVQIMNNRRPLQPGELYDAPEGWCVDTDTLGGWFGATVRADLRNAVLALDSERPLPFIDAIERRSRAARLRPQQTADLSRYPQAPQPYAMWRLPSVDVVAQADYRGGNGSTQLQTRYEVFASGELGRASVDARLASDSQGQPESLRLRAYRFDPQGRLLGPLRATQAVAGDVDMLSGELAGAPGVGRGLFLSNRALQRPSRFGTTILRGALPLGWDAELYRNGQLLAFQGDGHDGRYEFEVPLIYGTNDLEVVLYGPQGQIRRESQSIPVGQGTVAPGRIEYWAGIIQRNRDLISFGHDPPSWRDDVGWQYAAGLQYGLDRRTVVGASAHSLVVDERRRDYAELNLQRAVGAMLLNLTAAQELGQGRGYRADLIGKIGPVQVLAESFFVDGDFTSWLVEQDETSAHRLQLESVIRAGRTAIPLSAGYRRTTERGGRDVDEFQMRASLMLPRVALTGFVLRRQTSGGAPDPEDGTKLGLLANTRFLGLTVRGEATYRVAGSRKGFESATLTLEKALDNRSDLRAEVEQNGRNGVTGFELGYVRQFRRFALRASGRTDTEGVVGARLAVSFSFGPDPLGGGWRLSSDKLAQRGQAAVAVFLDEDGDGRRSPSEQALQGVGVNAGTHGAADPTDDAGHSFVEGLQPYDPVLVSVDESTLPDPFLVPRGKGMVVTPRPGVPAVVELAVSPTGEVEGVLVSPEGAPLAGVALELVAENGETAAAALTEYDGFFLFERVVYGRYGLRLSIDSERALELTLPPELASSIEIGAEVTTERLGTLKLRPALTIARARGPPAGGSP